MKHFQILACCCLIALMSCLNPIAGCAKEKVHVIFDSDIAPDYDDVGALAILHALADKGEADILATVSSNLCETCVPCLSVINTYFHRPDIPLGCVKGLAPNITNEKLSWQQYLVQHYPHSVESSSKAEDAIDVYRRVLSSQPDRSVTIISVGFLTNLKNLLLSRPDKYSELTGEELVRRKVVRLVSMAGSMPTGFEFNVMEDATASLIVFRHWPTPITLSGFEIGDKILTGKRLAQSGLKGNPIVDVFSISLKKENPEGRKSWDETAVLVGVRGASPYFKTERGRMDVDVRGRNYWTPDANGPCERLLFDMPIPKLTKVIENLMLHQPKR